MNKDFLPRMIRVLKNNELENLVKVIESEQHRRAEKRIEEGRYSPLDESEKALLNEGNVEGALELYMERTNCPRVMALMVFELDSRQVEAL